MGYMKFPPFAITWTMCHHAGTMHKVAWRHFRDAVYSRINVYASGHEKVSSGNLGSGTLADKTPAHWPRPTENWWSDPQSKLLDWQNPETGPKGSTDPRSTVFFKSANLLDLSPKSTIRELFKAKSADPWTYSFPSIWLQLKGAKPRAPMQNVVYKSSATLVLVRDTSLQLLKSSGVSRRQNFQWVFGETFSFRFLSSSLVACFTFIPPFLLLLGIY